MTRNEFINTLFDNGDGLTLAQISELVYDIIPDELPDGLVDSIKDSVPNIDHNTALDIAMQQSYDVFIQRIADCKDLLEISDLLGYYFKDVTDKQILSLRYCATIER